MERAKNHELSSRYQDSQKLNSSSHVNDSSTRKAQYLREELTRNTLSSENTSPASPFREKKHFKR